MFEGFANVWTPVTLSRRLRSNAPLAVEVAGEKLVFFKGQDGAVKALRDRCPHRGVQLSLGKVKGGCLECPFHAWQFDGTGAAQHVPLNPDARRDRLFATAVPARELGGLLWVYTAPGALAPHEPAVPDGLTRPDMARTYLEVEWNTHWTRAMENMLDSPHVPYLHQRTIGRFVRPYLKRDSRMDITWEDRAWGGRTTSAIDGQADSGAALDWYQPNIMVLNIPVPKQVFRMHAICVPVSATTTRMIVVGARTFATARVLNPLFNWSNRRIVNEDRAVVESSQPLEVPLASEEVSVRTDRATLQFRKYYFQVLKPSSASHARRDVRSVPDAA